MRTTVVNIRKEKSGPRATDGALSVSKSGGELSL